jgi:membrane-bound lytic murein transglycosylase D
MTVNSIVDERLDPIEATKAAARYLRSAYDSLRSWPLAITSYNHGVGGVLKKTRQLGTNDIGSIVEHPTKRLLGFASNNFYAEFIAAVEIYENRHKYFPEIELDPPIEVREYVLPHPASVSYLTKQLGVSQSDLEAVNRALAKGVWSGRTRVPANYRLKIPLSGVANLDRLDDLKTQAVTSQASTSSVFGGVAYRVRRGDTLGAVAKRFHVSPNQIRELNSLSTDTLRVGQLLKIREREDAPPAPAPTKPPANMSPPEIGATYRVRAGDSLYRIAKLHGTTVQALRDVNSNLKLDRLTPGQLINLPSGSGKGGASTVAAESKTTQPKVETASGKTYVVKAGDSLWTISKRMGVSLEDLKRANGLGKGAIKPGQMLRVP